MTNHNIQSGELVSEVNVTRGDGLLENFLSKRRSIIADKKIPAAFRRGCILDIGCGSYPLFLIQTNFNLKYGLDKIEFEENDYEKSGITILRSDIENDTEIPFENNCFDVVTMLAVFEHIQPKLIVNILKEIYRILKPNGKYIMTTPTIWTDQLLKVLAKLRLVSPIEIEEHKGAYNPLKIISLLNQANFSDERIQYGYFELFMNIWLSATK